MQSRGKQGEKRGEAIVAETLVAGEAWVGVLLEDV